MKNAIRNKSSRHCINSYIAVGNWDLVMPPYTEGPCLDLCGFYYS